MGCNGVHGGVRGGGVMGRWAAGPMAGDMPSGVESLDMVSDGPNRAAPSLPVLSSVCPTRI